MFQYNQIRIVDRGTVYKITVSLNCILRSHGAKTNGVRRDSFLQSVTQKMEVNTGFRKKKKFSHCQACCNIWRASKSLMTVSWKYQVQILAVTGYPNLDLPQLSSFSVTGFSNVPKIGHNPLFPNRYSLSTIFVPSRMSIRPNPFFKRVFPKSPQINKLVDTYNISYTL